MPTRAEIVPIDLRKEVLKMAAKANLRPEDLDKEVTMPNADYYAACVKAHYQGRDQGFAEALRSRLSPFHAYIIGFATPFVLVFLYRMVFFIYHVWTFVPPNLPE